MKILVTGGAGFIGSNLVDKLIEQGHNVIVYDDLSTGLKENVNPKATFFNPKSFFDDNTLDYFIKRVDCIYHLAASVGYFNVLKDASKSFFNNITLTESIAYECDFYNKKLLLASSSEVYGHVFNWCCESENDFVTYGFPEHPKDAYAVSKWASEFLVRDLMKDTNNFVIARLFNTSGKRQRHEFGMVVPRFVNQAINNSDITVFCDKTGNCSCRSFVHVDDVVNALIGLMESDRTNGNVYNVGDNINQSNIRQLAVTIKTLLNSKSKIVDSFYDDAYDFECFIDTKNRIPDVNKIYRIIGWEPKKSLKDIIKDNYKWQIERIVRSKK